MNMLNSLIAGFAGAAALNILHETLRKFDSEAPRIDLVGKEAVQKSAKALNVDAPKGDNLYGITLAGDLLSNATYFAGIGMGNKKFLPLRAIGAGLTAGFAALNAPEPLGLDDSHVANSDKRKIMTMGYYVFGALVTAGVLGLLTKK